MKKLKKFLSSILAGALFMGVAACSSEGSSSSDSSSGSNTMTVWCWDENFNIKAVETAKAIYLEENPDVEINIVNMSQDDIVQKMNTALSSGSIDTLPNLVLIEDYRIQGYLTAYDNAFEELDDIVNADDFMAYKMAVNTVDGHIYGVPFDSGATGLFYRTDIIEEAGFTDEDLETITWDEYIDISKTILEKTGKQAIAINPSDIGLIRAMMQSAGAWYTADDGETVDLENNEVLKESLKTWKNMLDAGIVKQIADWDSYVNAFQTGEIWSVPTGCWIMPTIKVAEDQTGLWKAANWPRLDNISNGVNYSSQGGCGWYIIRGLDGNDLAKDFLAKTFASSTELMNQLVEDISLVSTLKAAAGTENYKLPDDYFSGQAVFEDFIEWTELIPSVNYGMHTYAIEDIVIQAAQVYFQGGDLDAALKDAQAQAEGAVSY